MSEKTLALKDGYLDFILSRKAKLVSEGMIKFYDCTAKTFLNYLEEKGIKTVDEISASHVRAFLSSLHERGLSDSYIHGNARAIRTMVRFFHFEGYTSKLIKFDMPKVEKKRLPFLKLEEVQLVLKACNSKRDKALFLFMIDTGLRRAELISLNWKDVNIENGVIVVRRGKGGKPRSVIIGIKTRRALLAYKRKINPEESEPLFQTRNGTRFTKDGFTSLFRRISNKSNIHISPHMLRRTFATLALKAGMNLVHLQGFLGHSSIEMTRHYIQMLDEDLIEAHNLFGPIDNFIK